MISISKPLSPGKTQSYYRAEYSAPTTYYAESADLKGDWIGKLAVTFGLEGQQIRSEHFDRLALGQNPVTGDQLIKHRDTIRTREGAEAGHRSAWDLTFSAPKSVSLAALVGGDERIVAAHRNAVRAALGQAEELIQARAGGNNPPVTTGKMLVAAFDHDTARPVEGYAAAQLHTHAVLFNMTEDRNGQARSLQSHELYVAAPLLTSVYQNHLEIELRRMGYTIERGKNHAPEIAGFTREYLQSESKRSAEIEAELRKKGMVGAESRSIAAHSTRDEKMKLNPDEVKAAHRANAIRFGDQPGNVVARAAERRVHEVSTSEETGRARKAVTFARSKLSERDAVLEQHQVLTEALRFVKGGAGLPAIARELEAQEAAGAFVEVHHVRPNAPLHRYTTPELIENERYVIERMRNGQDQVAPIALRANISARYPDLNEDQARLVAEVVSSRDQIMGVQGKAGAGKSFALTAMNQMAREAGYITQGLGPTGKATSGLKEAGIESETLQRFLVRGVRDIQDARPRLYFVDEASLSSGAQMRAFLYSVGARDRVLLVGDSAQHESVDAGRIFGQLQEAGMRTGTLSKILRQRDPELLKAVETIAAGDIGKGIGMLGDQGRIASVPHREQRFAEMARDFAAHPEGTLVISPDNQSRGEINAAIREEMKRRGQLGEDVFTLRVLVNRQKVTGADRTVATSYEPGDVVRYRTGSKEHGLDGQSYATVLEIDGDRNTVTVKKADGKAVTYSPERVRGVSIYEPEERAFAVGDRIQFTAPSRALGVSNRDTGDVVYLDGKGNARVKLDSGRTVGFSLKTNAHVEHAYAMTSHSSQGVTVDRVMVHVDTSDSRIQPLVNSTLAYVALSRPRFEARVYTDDSARLASALARHQSNTTALSQEEIRQYRDRGMAA